MTTPPTQAEAVHGVRVGERGADVEQLPGDEKRDEVRAERVKVGRGRAARRGRGRGGGEGIVV